MMHERLLNNCILTHTGVYSRTSDAHMIANYRVQTELSAVETTQDGSAIILGTVDGCVSVLAITDPEKPEMAKFLSTMPSRDEEVRLYFPHFLVIHIIK